MSLCPEHDKRAAMTDDEFWSHVFGGDREPDNEPDPEDFPGFGVTDCIRCGKPITADDYEVAATMADSGVELCDTCADELTDEPQELAA